MGLSTRVGGEVKMSENKQCPLNRDYYCDDRCKWFDVVIKDCKFINIINAMNKTIFKGLDALFQKS